MAATGFFRRFSTAPAAGFFRLLAAAAADSFYGWRFYVGAADSLPGRRITTSATGYALFYLLRSIPTVHYVIRHDLCFLPQATRSRLRQEVRGGRVIRMVKTTWRITRSSPAGIFFRLLHQTPHRRRRETRTRPGSLVVTLGPPTGSCGRRVGHHLSASPDAVPDHLCMTYVRDICYL